MLFFWTLGCDSDTRQWHLERQNTSLGQLQLYYDVVCTVCWLKIVTPDTRIAWNYYYTHIEVVYWFLCHVLFGGCLKWFLVVGTFLFWSRTKTSGMTLKTRLKNALKAGYYCYTANEFPLRQKTHTLRMQSTEFNDQRKYVDFCDHHTRTWALILKNSPLYKCRKKACCRELACNRIFQIKSIKKPSLFAFFEGTKTVPKTPWYLRSFCCFVSINILLFLHSLASSSRKIAVSLFMMITNVLDVLTTLLAGRPDTALQQHNMPGDIAYMFIKDKARSLSLASRMHKERKKEREKSLHAWLHTSMLSTWEFITSLKVIKFVAFWREKNRMCVQIWWTQFILSSNSQPDAQIWSSPVTPLTISCATPTKCYIHRCRSNHSSSKCHPMIKSFGYACIMSPACCCLLQNTCSCCRHPTESRKDSSLTYYVA